MAVARRRVHHDGMSDGVIAGGGDPGDTHPGTAAAPVGRREPSGPPWLSPSVVVTSPLRAPGPAVAARQQARRNDGLDEDGLGYPRSQLWLLAVLPAAVIALLCLVVLVVTQAAVWGVAAAAVAAIAAGSAGYLMRDPLRVTSAERRELVADRSWHSVQPWTGELAHTSERRMLAQAQAAVTSLVGAPAWSSSAFEEHRLRLDLKAELDEIDRAAYQLASTGPTRGASALPPAQATPPPQATSAPPAGAGEELSAHAAAAQALRRRVDALSAYADAVTALPAAPPVSTTDIDTEDRVHQALSAAVRDEFGAEQWILLRDELPAEPDGRWR